MSQTNNAPVNASLDDDDFLFDTALAIGDQHTIVGHHEHADGREPFLSGRSELFVGIHTIGERTYPVIGGVTASHMILEIGDERTVSVGDVATLVGPDHPDVHPNELARVSGGNSCAPAGGTLR